MVTGLWLCSRLHGTPQEEGLPTVGQWRHDPSELRQEQLSPPLPMRVILKETILCNRMIWLLGFSYILVYLIRMAINDWGNLWLSETHGSNLLSANATLSLFELGGLLGAVCAGWGSDILFRGQRAPMILLFSLGLFIAVSALWLIPIHHYGLLAACFFSTGFFVFGPQMLIGLAATEYCHKSRRYGNGLPWSLRLLRGGNGRVAARAGHGTLRLAGHVYPADQCRGTDGITADAAADS